MAAGAGAAVSNGTDDLQQSVSSPSTNAILEELSNYDEVDIPSTSKGAEKCEILLRAK